jgi:hypothetical protein
MFYMEVGLLGYFVAGIWGSYSMMVLTYLYVAVLYASSQVLKTELPALQATGRGAPVTARRFGRPSIREVIS